MNLARLAAPILITFWCAGCDRATTPQPAPALLVNDSPHLDRAMPKLPTVKLWVGAQELETEVAITMTQVATGMMFRQKMEENEAMLFVFAEPQPRQFYMKNCTVPLSAAYIDPEGVIVEIVPLQPGVEAPVPSKSDQVQFVLETKQGWFERHNVSAGAIIRTERGTLRDSFAGRAVMR